MEFSVDHNKYYRGYGKNRKNAHEKKVDMYQKKSKCVQRNIDRNNKHAILDITNNYNLPQKMTRNCKNLKYTRYTHYKNIEDYFEDLLIYFMEIEFFRELVRKEQEKICDEQEYNLSKLWLRILSNQNK